MTDDFVAYANELWATTMDRIDRDLPIAHYEVERLAERLHPILERMHTGTMH